MYWIVLILVINGTDLHNTHAWYEVEKNIVSIWHSGGGSPSSTTTWSDPVSSWASPCPPGAAKELRTRWWWASATWWPCWVGGRLGMTRTWEYFCWCLGPSVSRTSRWMRPGCQGGRYARSTRGTLWPDRGSSLQFPLKTDEQNVL